LCSIDSRNGGQFHYESRGNHWYDWDNLNNWNGFDDRNEFDELLFNYKLHPSSLISHTPLRSSVDLMNALERRGICSLSIFSGNTTLLSFPCSHL